METIIRKWEMGDIDNLTEYANNKNISRYLTDGFPYPYTRQDAVEFITMAMNQEPSVFFAISLEGEAIGSVGLTPQTDVHCKNMEIGYFLGEPFWGKGIMTSVIRQTVAYAFRTFDITRVFARPFSVNTASHRALEKAGFTLEARFENTIYKKGVFMDELIYGIRKPE